MTAPPTLAPAAAWLSPEHAAAHLDVSPKTLANWRSEGGGPPYHRRGAFIRYNVVDLDRWMTEARPEFGGLPRRRRRRPPGRLISAVR